MQLIGEVSGEYSPQYRGKHMIVFGTATLLTVFTLILTSWAEIGAAPFIRRHAKKICLVLNVVIYVFLLLDSVVATITGTPDGVGNYFMAFVIIILTVGFLVYGGKIMYSFRKVLKLNSSQKQFKKLTAFTLGICAVGFALVISLISANFIIISAYGWAYIWRFLEVCSLLLVLIILQLPRKELRETPSEQSTERNESARASIDLEVSISPP